MDSEPWAAPPSRSKVAVVTTTTTTTEAAAVSPATQRRTQMLEAIERRGIVPERRKKQARRPGREVRRLSDHLRSGPRDAAPSAIGDRSRRRTADARPTAAEPRVPVAPRSDVDGQLLDADVDGQRRLLDAALLASAADAAGPPPGRADEDDELQRAIALSLQRDDDAGGAVEAAAAAGGEMERAMALSLAVATASRDADEADVARAIELSLAESRAGLAPAVKAEPEAALDATTEARVAALVGFGFSRADAARAAARCDSADEATLWLLEERERREECRAVDEARERSEADADAAKRARAALDRVDEAELAFGVGAAPRRKRERFLREATDPAAVELLGKRADLRALLLDDARSSARRELLRLLALARDAVRWYPASAAACVARRAPSVAADEAALAAEADLFADALFKMPPRGHAGGVPALFLPARGAQGDDDDVQICAPVAPPPPDVIEIVDR